LDQASPGINVRPYLKNKTKGLGAWPKCRVPAQQVQGSEFNPCTRKKKPKIAFLWSDKFEKYGIL
jgi:hypothetical protein